MMTTVSTHERTPTDERLQELRAMPYADYLQTPEWRRRREAALARALWICERAGCECRYGLQVHHKTYERLGEELPTDLVVLCTPHHQEVHAIGASQRLQFRILRELIDAGGYHSFADFVEAFKRRLHEYQIAYDPHSINDTITVLLRDITLTDVAPQQAVLESPPAVTHREACRLLQELRLSVTAVKAMPQAEVLTQRDADRAKALEMVLRELAATAARCEELEGGDG